MTIESIRRTNLAAVVAEAGGVKRAADRLGISPSQLSQWLHGAPDSKTGKPRGMGAGSCRKVESAFGRPEGWMDRQHAVAGEPPAPWHVAQDLSHEDAQTAIPLVPWELLMEPVADQIFRTRLPDDALAPDFPRGTEIVWSTTRRLAPGRLVLLRDRHGHAHARLCQQGDAPGQWTGAPLQRGYLSFDSAADRVEVLAVYKGVLEPDDD